MSSEGLTASQQIRLEAAQVTGNTKDVREVLVLAHAIEHNEVKRLEDFDRQPEQPE